MCNTALIPIPAASITYRPERLEPSTRQYQLSRTHYDTHRHEPEAGSLYTLSSCDISGETVD